MPPYLCHRSLTTKKFALCLDCLLQVALQAFDYLETDIECSKAVIYAGMKVMLIPFAYGILIYLVSLVVRICQKPKA